MTMQKTPDFHVFKALGKVAAADCADFVGKASSKYFHIIRHTFPSERKTKFDVGESFT